jgi:hypothetical protein
MKKRMATRLITLALALAGTSLGGISRNSSAAKPAEPKTYLGFDRNVYPGDALLPFLRKSFAFSGYWLNNPPGESANSWQGKREILKTNGFGFLVLFNGRLEKELKSESRAKILGARDASATADVAKREGFAPGTIIFLDQEEGGRLTPKQQAYVFSWVDGVSAAGFRAGVYCSGIPAPEAGGVSVITANDIHQNAGSRQIFFFVYNDACPPSPGCAVAANPPAPQASSINFASVWQFAQSPRRKEFTAKCASSYASDGNCYAPQLEISGGREGNVRALNVDLDSAMSPDPSGGRN